MGFFDRWKGTAPAAPARVRMEPVLDAGAFGAPRAKGSGTSTQPGSFLGLGMLPGSTGIPVTPYTALQAATVYACCKRLSEDIGKLPIRVHRRLPRGGTRVDHEHPLNRLFRRPNRWQTPSQCWRYYVWNLALRGNGYAPILRGAAGQPLEIIPVSPDRVGVLQSQSGEVFYQINHPAWAAGTKVTREDMLHTLGMTYDGVIGVSPLAVAQDAVGLALATQQHGATLFRQGAQLNGFIKHPGNLSREAKNYLAEEFAMRHAGVQNAHRTPVLDEGMAFEKVAMTNEDAQFLATRQTQVVEICRYFGVPPHKVFDLSNAHFNNLEQSEQQYVNDTLLPLGKQLEEECERGLLFEDDQGEILIRLEFDALLRADRKTRYDTYRVGVEGGWLSRNEARIDDNREPNVPNGDEFLQPLNMATTTDAAAGGKETPAPGAAAPAAVPGASDPALPETEQENQ